jgi:hypothetical protein
MATRQAIWSSMHDHSTAVRAHAAVTVSFLNFLQRLGKDPASRQDRCGRNSSEANKKPRCWVGEMVGAPQRSDLHATARQKRPNLSIRR